MESPGHVVVVSQTPAVTRLVAEVVDSTDGAGGCRACRTLPDLAVMLDEDGADVVFVDLDGAAGETLRQLDSLTSRYSGTKFVVVASERTDELALQAMRAGARDFLDKADLNTALPRSLERLIPIQGAGAVINQSFVTVLSAGGGCGATTLAVNLAQELQHHGGESSLLIDLDMCHGGVAGYLGLYAEYCLTDVLADGERIDAHLVRTTAFTREDGLHVLLNPASKQPGFTLDFNAEHLETMFVAIKRSFRHVVIDAPRVSLDLAGMLAANSSTTLLVLEANIDDVRIARHQMEVLLHRGIPAERIIPIMNRFRKGRAGVNLTEARRAIGVKHIVQLSNDYKHVIQGINLGKTLAESAPRSALRREIRRLAQSLAAARTVEP